MLRAHDDETPSEQALSMHHVLGWRLIIFESLITESLMSVLGWRLIIFESLIVY